MSYLNSIQDKATLDAAQAFLATADSRETSEELMEAIFKVSGENSIAAVELWENGPDESELIAIIEMVTKNGTCDTADFCWGAAGSNWTIFLG